MIDSAPMKAGNIRLAVITAACVAALTGCGGGGGGIEPSARNAAQEYVDAWNKQDYAKVCDLYSDSYKQQLKASNCLAYLREQTSGAATTLTLVDVQERGNQAAAHIRSHSENKSSDETAGLIRQQDGSWKLAVVTGYSEKEG